MIRVYYYRKITDINDVRLFKDLDELNRWLSDMYELEDEYYITKIEAES